jgi:phenylacetate-CoA oxygenase PaaJ subunit
VTRSPQSEAVERAETARAAAARVTDPEVPVLTIDDLGILHEVDVDDHGHVTVSILPTYSGCPAMGVIALEIETELAKAGFADVSVNLTNNPVWTTDRMSDAAREKLSAHGISSAPVAVRAILSACRNSVRPRARRSGAAAPAASRSNISNAPEACAAIDKVSFKRNAGFQDNYRDRMHLLPTFLTACFAGITKHSGFNASIRR